MPVPEIEALTSTSEDAQIKAALSSCIATEVKNGTPQDQAAAVCYSMIKEKTGKEV
jgi:hypothetical protein